MNSSSNQFTKYFSVKYYTKEQIRNSPSFKDGYDSEKEKKARVQAVKFIQRMSTELKL